MSDGTDTPCRPPQRALRAAGRLAGVASHLSAASIHGWELATQPGRPQVIVPRGRKIEPARRRGIEVRWRTPLEEHEVVRGIVTEPHRTVIDCARDLPFADALAVADSRCVKVRSISTDWSPWRWP